MDRLDVLLAVITRTRAHFSGFDMVGHSVFPEQLQVTDRANMLLILPRHPLPPDVFV